MRILSGSFGLGGEDMRILSGSFRPGSEDMEVCECRPLIPLKETIKNSHQQKKGRKLLLGSRHDAEWFEGSGNLWKCGIAEDGVDQRNFSSLFLLVRRHEWQSAFSFGKMPITRLPDGLRS